MPDPQPSPSDDAADGAAEPPSSFDVAHDESHPIADRDADDASSTGATGRGGVHMSYWRFGAMIATSTIVMFALMYLNTYAWDHVRWSETRAYMALLMGATMAVIMLGFMFSMYKSLWTNVGIFALAIVLGVGSLWLVRSQVTVQDRSFMRAMIPHHSIAILTSERSELSDVRVCELAVEIIEAQRREIDEMDWLISDIAENGAAETAADAEARPVPDFSGTSIRDCP